MAWYEKESRMTARVIFFVVCVALLHHVASQRYGYIGAGGQCVCPSASKAFILSSHHMQISQIPSMIPHSKSSIEARASVASSVVPAGGVSSTAAQNGGIVSSVVKNNAETSSITAPQVLETSSAVRQVAPTSSLIGQVHAQSSVAAQVNPTSSIVPQAQSSVLGQAHVSSSMLAQLHVASSMGSQAHLSSSMMVAHVPAASSIQSQAHVPSSLAAQVNPISSFLPQVNATNYMVPQSNTSSFMVQVNATNYMVAQAIASSVEQVVGSSVNGNSFAVPYVSGGPPAESYVPTQVHVQVQSTMMVVSVGSSVDPQVVVSSMPGYNATLSPGYVQASSMVAHVFASSSASGQARITSAPAQIVESSSIREQGGTSSELEPIIGSSFTPGQVAVSSAPEAIVGSTSVSGQVGTRSSVPSHIAATRSVPVHVAVTTSMPVHAVATSSIADQVGVSSSVAGVQPSQVASSNVVSAPLSANMLPPNSTIPRHMISSTRIQCICSSTAPMMMMSSISLPTITPDNYTVISSQKGFRLHDIIMIPRGQNIAIFNTTIMSGQIQVSDASGLTWNSLASVAKSSAIVRTKESFMRFQHSPNDPSYYGLVVVDFVLTSQSSGTLNVPSSSLQKKLFILVPPQRIVPKFNSTNTLEYELQEDSSCISVQPSNSSTSHPYGLQVKPFVFDEKKFMQFRMEINETAFMRFQNMLAAYASYKPAYWIRSVTRGKGRWFYTSGRRTPFEDSFAVNKITVESNKFAFCFVPAPDFFGEVSMVLTPAFLDGVSPIHGVQELSVRIKINATNDRPVVTIAELDIPALPYNLTGFVNSGFTIADLLMKKIRGVKTPAFTDKDGDTVGAAIISAPITSFGSWEYKCGSGSWQPLYVNYTPPLVNVTTLDMILLKPNDSLRFILKNESSFWSTIEAIQNKVSLQVLAWDQTDGQSCGPYQYSKSSPWPVSLSTKKNFAKGTQLRKGCDGRPGYVLKFDVCGVCGGNADCVGCDNVPNSGAIIDNCGNCTGGTTNVTFNYLLDCGKTCGDYTTDVCGVCVRKGSTEDFRDCNGDCNGDAVINDCGICTGGNTNKTINFGKDACGICGGDNSTCVDCANVPNGLKVFDLCGLCLLKTDPSFNTGCVKLGTFNPTSFYKSQLSATPQITIQGSGSISSPSCSLVHSISGTSTNAVSATVSGKIVTVTLPTSLTHGNYSVQCTIGNSVKVARSDLFIVDPSAMSVSSLSSSVVYHSESDNITVTGSGFLDTGEIACIFVTKASAGTWKKYGLEMKAVYQSATEIICHVKPVKKSVSGQLVVSLIKKNRFDYLSSNATFHRSINMSSVVSGAFSSSLGSLLITFSGPIDLKNQSATCRDIFPSNFAAFGSNPVCKVRGLTLAIVLDGIDATFTPGNIIVQMNELIVKRADYTIYPTITSTVNIPVPPNAEAPEMIIEAPNLLGRCDKLVVRSRKKIGGGRKLTYSWGIEWVSTTSSATANQQSTIQSINANLARLPSFSPKISIPAVNLTDYLLEIDIGVVINVTNFLGNTRTVKATIRRENKDLPRLVVSNKELKIKASKNVKLRAKVSLPACDGTGDAQVTYLWSLTNADGTTANVLLGNIDTPVFRILRGQLRGGRTYKARVDVTMKADPTKTAYETIEITVTNSRLEPRISGVQTIGSTETLLLSAKESFDPDLIRGVTPLYQWRILTENGGTVVKGRIQIMSDLATNTRDISINVAKYLISNRKYKIDLSYQIGDRKSTASYMVSVKAGTPPRITNGNIESLQISKSPIRLFADIGSQSFIGSFPVWSTTNGAEGTRLGGTTSTVYVIPSNALDEGSSYDYSLSVTNVDATATSSFSFSTNSRPTSGAMSVSPSSGVAFNTEFVIAADESGGWSDPDQNEVNFEIGYITSGGNTKIKLGNKQDSKFLEGVRLPEGTHELYVECCDIYGSCARQTSSITIAPVTTNTAFYDNFNAERQKRREKQDYDQMSALSITALQIMFGQVPSSRRRRRSLGGGLNCNGLSDATIQSQTDSLNDHLLPYEIGKLEFDDSSRDLFVERMGTFTQCGYTIFTTSLIKRSHDVLSAIISDFVSRTPTQVESDLISFDNTILATRYDSNTQIAKSTFRSSAIRQTQRMCLSLLPGEAAAIAQRTLANLQSIKLTLSESEANWTKLGCDSCTNGVKPSYVDVSSLKSTYGSSYTCSSSLCVLGTCLASLHYPTDLFDNSLNSSLLSSVLEIKLWEPKNSQLSLNLTNDLLVDIPIKTETNNSYKCLRWDSFTSTWIADGVSTVTGLPFARNSIDYVRCSMSMLAPIALFDGPERVTPTAPSNTSSILPSASVPVMNASVTTTLQPQDFPRKIRLTYPYNNCSNSQFNASIVLSIQTQIASHINASRDTLTQFNVTCGSVIITYIQIHSSGQTAAAAVASLQQALQNNRLNITFNGVTLSPDASSLVVEIQVPYYARTTTTSTTTVVAPPTEEDDELSGGAIAGIVIGVLIFILILGAVIYFVCCKKNSRKDNAVDPNENDVELRGKTNRAYHDSP